MAPARRQRLGQHFLTRRSWVERVVEAIAPLPGQRILEVGPGRGALTFPLLAAGASILAVELDRVLTERLRAKKVPAGSLTVVEGDILRVDLRDLVGRHLPGKAGVRVVGNLPYSVASPALRRLLPGSDLFSDWTVMVQREVADRILASPGSRLFGVLTLLCQCRAVPRRLFDLPPSCFTPPPRVMSTLLHFASRPSPFDSSTHETAFQRGVKAAFSSRRKMLKNTLQAALRLPAAEADAALRAAGLNPADRPEQIPLEGYLELARHLVKEGKTLPPVVEGIL